MKLKAYILLLYTFTLLNVTAQKIELKVTFNDSTLKTTKLINYNNILGLPALKDELSGILNQLHQKAFLIASTDSIIVDSSYFHVFIHLGKTYKWTSLTNKNIDEEILSKIGFRDKLYNDKPFSEKQLKNFFKKIILFYENNGYPFASIKLDSIQIEGNKLSAQLYLEKNRLYKIDSVLIKGNATISDQYIKNYIRIKDGDIYNEEAIRKISTRIKELPFVTEEKKWKVIFTEDNSKILLYLKKKQASRFDGILGLLPDEQTGKLRLTGDVKLNLINSFHNGEKIEFNWRAIQKNTQDLKFNVMYPFLVNTPFGIDYKFKLYKKDTTFIDVGHKIGIRYILKGNNYFEVFFHNKSSSLLSQTNFATLTVLPSYADVSSQLYGIEIHNTKLDYILNPRKGHNITFTGSLGNKTIKQNPQIDDKLYEDLNLKSTLYNSNLTIDYYIPITKRSVIKLASKNGYTFNENLFENELLRVGGLLTLRGFDEESIFASLYTIETIEYRYILEQNSYLYLFIDGAYYENDRKDEFLADRPIGFGAGMSFETRAGIFSISYAVGKQFDNPIVFRSAKIHFGFVNFF
ncbi:MAG: BamA/TamA family outer membrane protein [Flavobacteriales bacterium]|nr:BamA/TamA family outer membrane protein [Flavobacteriales bacterium]